MSIAPQGPAPGKDRGPNYDRLLRRQLSAIVVVLTATPALSCDVALVLAFDVSGSVDPKEYRLQADGLSSALGDGVVSEALVNAGAVVAVVQWSGQPHQALVIDWTATDTHADVATLRARIEAVPRAYRNYSTGIGEALRFSANLFETAPRECARKIIDVSGDGRNNEGTEPEILRQRLRAAEIDVNGLAIEGSEDGIAAYYRENVVVGPVAFVEVASGFEDFPRAIRRKLLRELADRFAEAK